MISLKPPLVPSLDRYHLDLPALLGGIALVHAEQVAGEQRGLVAAGAGADFEDGVALVHRVFGQQREADFLFERARAVRRAPASRPRPARASRRRSRIGEHRVEVGDFGAGRAIGLDRLDHRVEFGEFARQLDEGLAWQGRCRVRASTMRMADEQGVELCSAAKSSARCLQSCKSFGGRRRLRAVSRIETLPTGRVEQRQQRVARLCCSRDRAASP